MRGARLQFRANTPNVAEATQSFLPQIMERDGRYIKRCAAAGWAAKTQRGAPRLMAELSGRDGPMPEGGARPVPRKQGLEAGGLRSITSDRGARVGVGGTVTRKTVLDITPSARPELPDPVYPRLGHVAAPFGLQERGPGVCELAATPPALANASPRQVPAGYAQYQDPTLDPTTYVQWSLGQWRVMLPRALGGERSRRLLQQLQQYGAYQVGLARVGDALVPAALAPADRYALAQSINLQPCSARAILASDESAA